MNGYNFQVKVPQNVQIPIEMFLELLQKSMAHPVFAPMVKEKMQPYFHDLVEKREKLEKEEKEKNIKQYIYDVRFFGDQVGTEEEKAVLAKMIKKFEKKYDIASA